MIVPIFKQKNSISLSSSSCIQEDSNVIQRFLSPSFTQTGEKQGLPQAVSGMPNKSAKTECAPVQPEMRSEVRAEVEEHQSGNAQERSDRYNDPESTSLHIQWHYVCCQLNIYGSAS